MIESIAESYGQEDAPDIATMVRQALHAPDTRYEDARAYHEAERAIHDRFDAFVALRGIAASERYAAYGAPVYWEVAAFMPVSLTPSANRPLHAIPFREYDVVTTKQQVVKLQGGGTLYHDVPAPERLRSRAVGFYVTPRQPTDVLDSLLVREPWRNHHYADIGMAKRHSPGEHPGYGLTITPHLLENQRRFGQFLDEVIGLSQTYEV